MKRHLGGSNWEEKKNLQCWRHGGDRKWMCFYLKKEKVFTLFL
jgi:hypothetical protein